MRQHDPSQEVKRIKSRPSKPHEQRAKRKRQPSGRLNVEPVRLRLVHTMPEPVPAEGASKPPNVPHDNSTADPPARNTLARRIATRLRAEGCALTFPRRGTTTDGYHGGPRRCIPRRRYWARAAPGVKRIDGTTARCAQGASSGQWARSRVLSVWRGGAHITTSLEAPPVMGFDARA